MSPEQVRGQVAEASSDIFSLGCVLYEMIAGRRAFARETAAQTMTAILEQQVSSLAALEQPVPAELDRTLARCLEKDPKARLQSARDLAFALRESTSRPAAAPARAGRRGLPWIAAALIAVLAVAAAVWQYSAGGATDSIAILPFANASGNSDMEYLGDGITESLINSLAQIPNLAVMSRNAVFRYKGKVTDAQEIGRALKVEAVLTGRVAQRGDGLSVSAELIDVRNNRQLWGDQFNRKLNDILAIQEEISTEISAKLQLRLTGDEKQRMAKRYTQNADAYQLYLKGRYRWNKKTPDGFNRGIDYFQQAIDLDPNYAPAYAGIATSVHQSRELQLRADRAEGSVAEGEGCRHEGHRDRRHAGRRPRRARTRRIPVGMGLADGRARVSAGAGHRSRFAVHLRTQSRVRQSLVTRTT